MAPTIKKPKVAKKTFKFLTGVIVGSAVGSILGLTLAPKKGMEARKFLKDKSKDVFLSSQRALKHKKIGPIRRVMIKILTKSDKNLKT